MSPTLATDDRAGILVRVSGRVQGVGFRPTVARIALELKLTGTVRNDAEGLAIRVSGARATLEAFVQRIEREAPEAARIDSIATSRCEIDPSDDFSIAPSEPGHFRSQIAPDTNVCRLCMVEVSEPGDRRHRYPFATCAACGPRFSIVTGVPFDRAQTTMSRFVPCERCSAEYEDPKDRRFHAETLACPRCGPHARLVELDRGGIRELLTEADVVAETAKRIAQGEIVAIKGIGGFQLVCDATRADAVAALRTRKHRDEKPFALMARSLAVVRRYCEVAPVEEAALTSPAGPILLLDALPGSGLPVEVAGELSTLGFMLPTSPLHALLLDAFDGPLVVTSGNLSDEPQVIDERWLAPRLGGVADLALTHDRPIVHRVDDSVMRVMDGNARVLRRARGFAPGVIRLPEGFEAAPDVVAYGGDLKSTFCVLSRGVATLSAHQGDLDEVATTEAYLESLAAHTALFDHHPRLLVADRHPDYHSARLAKERASDDGLELLEVQHHHAHAAACMIENGRALDAPPVLAIVLDGLGWGEDDSLWGGELLLVDYLEARRLGRLEPVAMIGGDRASREPWRNLHAQLARVGDPPSLRDRFGELSMFDRLAAKPLDTVDSLLRSGSHAPLASSCGRLFDAVAAALGLAFDRQSFEGQAGMLLEAGARAALRSDETIAPYPFEVRHGAGDLMHLDPRRMWEALLADLATGTSPGIISARFHRGLAAALIRMSSELANDGGGLRRFDTIALSGGCFQNRFLFEEVAEGLRRAGFVVLTHTEVPTNDGGISLGQAAIAAARCLVRSEDRSDQALLRPPS